MYLIISILLGLCLGSIFYILISRKSIKSKVSPRLLMSALIMGMAGAISYFSIRNFDIYASLAIIITLIVLGFESISDICSMHTYTLPIYLSCVLILLVKTVYRLRNGDCWQLITMYEAVMLFGVCCYCISILVSKKIGYGDVDIYFLTFLTKPIFAFILIIVSILVFVKDSLSLPVKVSELSETGGGMRCSFLSRICAKKVPFVPFLMLGYMTFLLIGDV